MELFTYVIQAPYEKRREEWMVEIGNAIADLRNAQKIEVETLREDPAFTDTVLSATQAALRTRSALKRTALRNAVLNTAKGRAPEESLRLTFIRYVEELNDWQILLLDLFEDPPGWFKGRNKPAPEFYMGGLSSVVESAYPELRGRRDTYDQWWRDLHIRGLVTVDNLHTTMSGHGLMSGRLTSLGAKFLAFVES